jgi:hypothetical protein
MNAFVAGGLIVIVAGSPQTADRPASRGGASALGHFVPFAHCDNMRPTFPPRSAILYSMTAAEALDSISKKRLFHD